MNIEFKCPHCKKILEADVTTETTLKCPVCGVSENQLNDRQKKIMAQILKEGSVTNGWCRKHLPVVYDTIRRDLIALMKLNIIQVQGQGRTARYVLKAGQP